MMFPALRDTWKSLRSGFGSEPIALDLKAAEGMTFDTVNVDWYARNGFRSIYNVLSGGSQSWSGETVSLDSAQNHSVVWACKRIISETLGFLPLYMMQERDGKYQAKDHPMFGACLNAPNDEMTAMSFQETLTGHCVLGGNAFAQILRRSGTGTAYELWPLMPAQVHADRDKQKHLCYIVKDGNSADKTYTVERGKPQDILHVPGLGNDGIRGYSVITIARHSIGAALGAERYIGKFWANGGRIPYQLKLAQKFKSEQEFDKFRADWEATYSDPNKAVILEPWITYDKIGMTMEDCQMLETRQFSIPEICRWFLISPHMVGDLSRATFSNIEELALQFVKFTLEAWLQRWQQNLWRCVLTPAEKAQGYFFKHDLSGLLSGDFVSRMAGYASALQNGTMNQDEVRDLEGRNPIPDGAGKKYHIQLNMQELGAPQPAAGAAPSTEPAAAHLATRPKRKLFEPIAA